MRPRWPSVAGAGAALLALGGLWLATRRAEVRLEDEVNADLARSAAAFFTVVTPGDGGRGYDPSRLLSSVGALAISSFWHGGLQGALGRLTLLPDTLQLTPLPDELALLVEQGAASVLATHGRQRAMLAPLFDRDRWDVLGWIAVWGALEHPAPGAVVRGIMALAAAMILMALGRFRAGVPPRRRDTAAVAAGLALLLAALGLAAHLRRVAAGATEVRLAGKRRLIEIAATADGVRRHRLPEIAVGARVSEATIEPVPRPPVEEVTIEGVTFARTFAATPRGGDDTGLELQIRPSHADLGKTWASFLGLLALGLGGLAFAAWSVGAGADRQAFRTTLAAWGFLAPALAHLAAFSFLPAAFTLYLAFHRWDLLSTARPFVGFDNFATIVSDGRFLHSLVVTAVYALHVPVTMTLALLAAVALDRSGVRVRLLRTVLFLPAVSSVVAIALVWQWVYQPDSGLLNGVLARVGLEGPDWLGDPRTALPALMVVGVWVQLGYQMVVFLGGLQAIPDTYHDAARVDGANAVQRFLSITLPLLRPTLLFVLVTSLIGSFQVFTYVAVMTEGGPLHATDVAVYRIYQEGWEFLRFGTASAMSLILLLILLGLTWLLFRWLGRRVEIV